MIVFNNVSKLYPNGELALNELSFECVPGDFLVINGSNGCGKSTLMRLITLYEQPSSGAILVQGKDVSRLPAKHIPQLRQNMGFIPQRPILMPHYSVWDNIALPLLMRGMSKKIVKRSVEAVVDELKLNTKMHVMPDSLSYSDMQRISIARALVHGPDMIIADEPTGHLDSDFSIEMAKLFQRWHHNDKTLLITSHDDAFIQQLNLPTLTLTQGKLIRE